MWSARVNISLRRPTVTLFYLTNDWVPHEKLNGFELGTGSPSQRTRLLDADHIRSRGSRRRRHCRRRHGCRRRRCGEPARRLHLHLSHMSITPMLLCRSYRRYGRIKPSTLSLLDQQGLFSPWYIRLLHILGIRPLGPCSTICVC